MQSQKRIEEDCKTIDAITKQMNAHNSVYSSLYNWRLAVKEGDDFNAARHQEDYALMMKDMVKPHVDNAILSVLKENDKPLTDEDFADIFDVPVEKIRGEEKRCDNMGNANKMVVVHLIEAIDMPCGYPEMQPNYQSQYAHQ